MVCLGTFRLHAYKENKDTLNIPLHIQFLFCLASALKDTYKIDERNMKRRGNFTVQCVTIICPKCSTLQILNMR